MALSWIEIKDRALRFANEWKDDVLEDAEAKSFQNDFFTVFGSSLADLYDPLTMPPALVKAHQDLDRAVDQCYRPPAFLNESRRIESLFELYEQYTAPLMASVKGSTKLNKRRAT